MAKGNKFTAEEVVEGKVYTDGRTAGIQVIKVYSRFGSLMVKFRTVVGKQFKNNAWTMGTFLDWAKEEVTDFTETPQNNEEVVNHEQATTDEPVRDAEEAASSTEA